MTRGPSLSAEFLLLGALVAASVTAAEPIDIGSRRELFVDSFLVDHLSGAAQLRLHQPTPHEVVLVTGEPWEGNTCAYYTIFQDGDLCRMYYRGAHYDEQTKKEAHPEVTCYAESKDGVHWTKPHLGLFEFAGSKENNIVWNGPGTHNFTPFKDDNPACPPESRYKALAGGRGGLVAIHSPDGIHWSLMREQPVITKGAFDSQNLAFWDAHAGAYREYHRQFRGVRDIMTATTTDFLSWPDPQFLDYGEAPLEHLYTNAIRPYPRAPHILIGFPTRFQPAHEQVEPTFMASRDGLHFHRWPEPVIPITAPEDRDGNRSNYMTWGLVQLPGQEREYSVYATEKYYTGPNSRVRRFTYRVDGFTSLSAGAEGGELVTKPLTFAGKTLELNYKAAERGSVRIELQDVEGRVIHGFSAEACRALKGDEIAAAVTWGKADVAHVAREPVRIRFFVSDADIYSWRFAGD
jgi:hypothetical protein